LAILLPVWAGDGVIEINQAKAQAGGVTAGDTPGFPVRIGAAGSYRLTGNLDVPADTDGIVLISDNVRLDLGGFTIASAGGVSLSARGVEGPNRKNIAVRNGIIRDFPGQGVYGQFSSIVATDLVIVNNGDDGLNVGANSIIRNCVVVDSGDHGVLVMGPSLVVNTISRGSDGSGFFLLSSAGITIKDCVASNNGYGIYAFSAEGNRIESNHVLHNTIDGIRVVTSGNVVIKNTAGGNGTDFNIIGAGNFVGTIVSTEANMNSATNGLVNIIAF